MAPSLSKFSRILPFDKIPRNSSLYIGLTGIGLSSLMIAYGYGVMCLNKTNKSSVSEYPIEYTITAKEQRKKISMNAEFFHQFRQLLKIIIPKLIGKESALIILIASSMIGKSICEMYLLKLFTLNETLIITKDMPNFKRGILDYVAILPLCACIPNFMKWCIGQLHYQFRTNLTQFMYQEYLNGFTYYKMVNLDNRISNPEQLLTNDIDKFSISLIDLFTNLFKPFIDICIYIPIITKNLGLQPASSTFAYLMLCAVILIGLRRPISRFVITEQKLEGEFRYINSRLINNSEEVAFYNGNNREKLTVFTSYAKLLNHLKRFLKFKIGVGVIDTLLAKYLATLVGVLSIAWPFFTPNMPSDTKTRSLIYYASGRYLVSVAEAVGRLAMAGSEAQKLTAFVVRLNELMTVLKDLNAGKHGIKTEEMNGNRTNSTNGNLMYNTTFGPNKGKIMFQNNIIRFNKVPLVTPNGDILVSELSFEVKSGMNVLVCGPNGCGKSSLFRTLGELWPIWGGELTKPPRGKLFYVPQKPYMTLGTLRDQIIYPHTYQDMMRLGKTDDDLRKYLEHVHLSYLETSRHKGLGAVEDWIDILSGGEKQRIAMARLFYHNPQFAILDECTSAISVDVENLLYEYCRNANITLFSVSHRKSLWKHHEYFLKFDGRGNYEFGTIDNTVEEFGS